MPSRFSPVVIRSASAISATTAWGRMPSAAMGIAASAAIRTPQTMPDRPHMPQKVVRANTAANATNAHWTIFFLPNFLASRFTGT
jgi:hypothetical protein